MPDDLPLKVDVAELGRKIARLERRVERGTHHTLINEAIKRAMHILTVRVEGFGKRRGGLGAVLK